MAELQPLFSTLWVVWFFLLFGGILIWVMRPSRREEWRRRGEMIFRDEKNG
ncbi:CcoQ/FixQ family Cbb3-type cytochrome c oxidase assembly chaperone [Rubritepida flocculans]|uniref:CcoQ/FixQ family Cbb3-type cytochrome c oxidase assembly chaperone n=1 Tax=Rubritepida flocculans TaxID=182403 RepID=UPI00040E0E3A|nr:CcoQ/FixQ family Cbb3-type cytochrome c oxidase assembly chaperone [Rubritepida flocculans]